MLRILEIAGLYVFVSIFSTGTEATARIRIFVIAVAMYILQMGLTQSIPGVAGLLAASVASVVIVPVALIFWCGVERKPALKITASWFALCVVMEIIITVLYMSTAQSS